MDLFLEGMSRLPRIALVPFTWQFQPVDTTEVAARLVDIATQAKPAGLLPDFGGPEPRDFKSLATSRLAARRPDKPPANLPLPVNVSRPISAGAVPPPEHPAGTRPF